MGQAIDQVVKLWDDVVRDFLDGRPTNTRSPLDRWFRGYAGQGRGEVDTTCFPEPYLGDLTGRPRAAMLALNPGTAVHQFQAPGGIFTDEVREMGTYSLWAASWPYLRDPWDAILGRNKHHRVREAFLRRWFADDTYTSAQRVDFELYPWHSKSVTAAMRPDPGIVREFIWEPLSELPIEFIFAFGAPWLEILPRLPGVEIVDRIGDGGRPYPTTSKPRAKRAVVKASTPTGAWFIVEKHGGSAAPPGEREVALIKQEFGFE